jgi:hypothetical protein
VIQPDRFLTKPEGKQILSFAKKRLVKKITCPILSARLAAKHPVF